jgi:hypothetical protein
VGGGGTGLAGTSSAGGSGSSAGTSSIGAAGSSAAAGSGSGGASGAGGFGSDAGVETGGGGAGGGMPTPTGPIDFRYWVLQLPTGSGTSPDTVSSAELLAGFQNEYFYPTEGDGRAFMDPKQGVTTSGSTRCRSELREQDPAGGNAAWPSSGSHTLTVEGAVTKLGGGNIAVAQLFNRSDSIPLGELQYSTGHRFSLWYQEAKGSGNSTDLKTSIELGAKYTFELAMTDGTFTVAINGKQVYSHRPSSGILDNEFYFKVGNYDQSTSAGTPSTTPYSIVEAYEVDVVHQ